MTCLLKLRLPSLPVIKEALRGKMQPAFATRVLSSHLVGKTKYPDFKYSALLNVTTMDNEVLSLGRDGTNRDYIDSGQARTRQGIRWQNST